MNSNSTQLSFASLIPFTLLAVLSIWVTTSNVFAQETFAPVRFEFDGPDGSEVPADWELGVWPDGTRTIEDGSFVINAPNDFGGANSNFLFEPDDFIVETQVRFLEERPRVDFASVFVRDTDPAPGDARGYFGAISSEGLLLLARTIPTDSVDPNLQVSATGFDAVNQDLKLRLVANGSSIELFAWPATDPMPTVPQLALEDDRYLDGGYIGLFSSTFQAGTPASPIAFRYVEISPVPEPNAGFMGIVGGLFVFHRFRKTRFRLEG